MSKEQSHELQQQPPLQLSPDQPQQSQQQQFNQPQFSQQQTIPTDPPPTHNHLPGQETAADHGPPSYEQAKASPAGQPPAGIAPGQAVTTVTPLNQLTNTPEWIDCPFCHKRTKTTVRSEGGSMQM